MSLATIPAHRTSVATLVHGSTTHPKAPLVATSFQIYMRAFQTPTPNHDGTLLAGQLGIKNLSTHIDHSHSQPSAFFPDSRSRPLLGNRQTRRYQNERRRRSTPGSASTVGVSMARILAWQSSESSSHCGSESSCETVRRHACRCATPQTPADERANVEHIAQLHWLAATGVPPESSESTPTAPARQPSQYPESCVQYPAVSLVETAHDPHQLLIPSAAHQSSLFVLVSQWVHVFLQADPIISLRNLPRTQQPAPPTLQNT